MRKKREPQAKKHQDSDAEPRFPRTGAAGVCVGSLEAGDPSGSERLQGRRGPRGGALQVPRGENSFHRGGEAMAKPPVRKAGRS